MNNKALSPVIGTVLLISIAIILAGLIFTWARLTVIELAPISHNCEDVIFTAEITNFQIGIVNKGHVNLEGIQIKSIEQGSIKTLETINQKIPKGDSRLLTPNQFPINTKLLIVPIIKAQTQDKEIDFNCPDDKGLELE